MKAEVTIEPETGTAMLRLLPEGEGDEFTLQLLKEVDSFKIDWYVLNSTLEDRQP
jgi:hypothetical protein